MTVRLRLALTLFATGLLTALCVIATVIVAFQRIERETQYDRADRFLGRVVSMYDHLLELHERQPDELLLLLRNLLLFEQDTQLYLLDPQGRVLAHTGQVRLAPDFRVSMAPVRQAAQAAVAGERAAFVMGVDPERMDGDAVVAARALQRASIQPGAAVAGYLYLVCHKPELAGGRLDILRSAFVGPALSAVAVVVTLTTLLALWMMSRVTRPLRRLSQDVARATRDGLSAPGLGAGHGQADAALDPVANARPGADKPVSNDEFSQLRVGFDAMLAALRRQWQSLREMDHFRREGVSNLSHDLRSPLTATVACLETLERRWLALPADSASAAGQSEDRRLLEVALRNSRNAAQLVRSLGDLALLDEPGYQLHPVLLDLGEVLDDIALRYAERAAQQGVELRCEGDPHGQTEPHLAFVDVELFERAIANLIDNALRFTPSGGEVSLGVSVTPHAAGAARRLQVCVRDSGSGIAAQDLDHLFDRFYQGQEQMSRNDHAPAAPAEGGRGLGLAIVKRIVELHGGHVSASSTIGQGTEIRIELPQGLI